MDFPSIPKEIVKALLNHRVNDVFQRVDDFMKSDLTKGFIGKEPLDHLALILEIQMLRTRITELAEENYQLRQADPLARPMENAGVRRS